MQIGLFNLFHNYVAMNGAQPLPTGAPLIGNGGTNGLDVSRLGPRNGLVGAQGLGTALQHNTNLMGWIGLCQRAEFVESYMAEVARDIKVFYKGCDKRLNVLERDFLPRSTDAAHQEEFHRLQTKFQKVRADLERPGRFPDKDELKSERERLRILYYHMRDLALNISSDPDDLDDQLCNLAPAVPRQKPSDPLYDVGDVIPALKNSPSRLARGMLLRPHQEKALQIIRREIKLSEENEDFAHDDMIIGLPTGSGKTRVMAGTIAMGMKEGWAHFELGDKIIVTTHRKNIGDQNLKTFQEQLGPIFEEKYGRSINVSRFDQNHKDVSGDVIVVSIPSGLSENKKHKQFFTAVEDSLGDTGRLAMLEMDEVHHEDAPSWQQFKERTLKIAERRGNNIKILGFTGTPKIEQRARVIYEMSQHEAMVKGIIPLTDIVTEKSGIRLANVSRGRKTGEFTQRTLSNAVDTPERNKFIMESMVKRAIRNEAGNGFATALTFAVDLNHADHLADTHVQYFGAHNSRFPQDQALFKRKIAKAERKITLKQLRAMLRDKEEGKIDAIVAVVYGKTKPAVLDLLFEEAVKGNIEAVYNCQKLEEGTDAYWARNLVGARPSLSFIRRPQEAGRIFRRALAEVDDEGRLLDIPLRRLIDIEDDYYDGHLVSYREVLGMRHMIPMPGVLYSLATQEPVNTEERRKETKLRSENRHRKAQKETEPRAKNDYEGVRDALSDVLITNYDGDLECMAHDLNMKPLELEEMLTVEGLRLSWQEIRHLERLLYLERGTLVQKARAGNSQRLQASLAQEALLESLKFYLASEDKEWKAQEIAFMAGAYEMTYHLGKTTLASLGSGKLAVNAVNRMATALYYVLDQKVRETTDEPEREVYLERKDHLQQAMDRFFGNIVGKKRLHRHHGQMMWDKTMQGIQERANRFTSKQRSEFITRWYRTLHPGEQEIPKVLYIATGNSSMNKGIVPKEIYLMTEDEYQQWSGRTDTNPPKIQVKWDDTLGWFVDRDNMVKGNDAVRFFLPALIKAGYITETTEYKLKRLTNVALESLDDPEIFDAMQKIAQEKGGRVFYLVGGCRGLHGDDRLVTTGLQLLSEQEYEASNYVDDGNYPKAQVTLNDNGIFTLENLEHVFGAEAETIYSKMVEASLIEEGDEFKLARLTRGQPLSVFANPEIKELIDRIVHIKGEQEYYIVAGSETIYDGNIVSGIQVLTSDEFEKWPGHDKEYYPKIYVQTCYEGLFVSMASDVDGKKADVLFEALNEAGVLIKGLQWQFQELTDRAFTDFNAPEILSVFDHIVQLKGKKTYFIVTGPKPSREGHLVGGLRILDQEEYQKWEGLGLKGYHAKEIEWDDELGWVGPMNEDFKGGKEKGAHILDAIVMAKLVTHEPEHELIRLTNGPLNNLRQERVAELIHIIMGRKNVTRAYITAGRGGAIAGRVNCGMKVMRQEEFDQWEGKDNRFYPKMMVEKQGNRLKLILIDGKETVGTGASRILKELKRAGVLAR